MLVCCGGSGGGFTLFVKDGKLHWEHNYYNEVRYRVSSTEPIPAGRHVLSAEIKVDKQGQFGTPGSVILRLGEKQIGEGRFENQIGGFFTANESFDVGCDTCSPVSDQYGSPFPFTGTIVRVMVDVSEAAFEDLAEQRKAHADWRWRSSSPCAGGSAALGPRRIDANGLGVSPDGRPTGRSPWSPRRCDDGGGHGPWAGRGTRPAVQSLTRGAAFGVLAAGALWAGQANASEGGASLYLLGSGGPEAAVPPPLQGVYADNTIYVYPISVSNTRINCSFRVRLGSLGGPVNRENCPRGSMR